jgi:hypothetical protein
VGLKIIVQLVLKTGFVKDHERSKETGSDDKSAVKTHKRAEQNLKRKRDQPREEGWFSPKAEVGRSRAKARSNESQMDIKRIFTMPPTVRSWKCGMMRWENLSSW